MARYSGLIGYATCVVDPVYPSVFNDTVVEVRRSGDLIREGSKWQPNQNLNEDLEITNRISIVADPLILEHMGNIKYITLYGSRWHVRSITVQHPRVILSLGGLYNGPTPTTV